MPQCSPQNSICHYVRCKWAYICVSNNFIVLILVRMVSVLIQLCHISAIFETKTNTQYSVHESDRRVTIHVIRNNFILLIDATFSLNLQNF